MNHLIFRMRIRRLYIEENIELEWIGQHQLLYIYRDLEVSPNNIYDFLDQKINPTIIACQSHDPIIYSICHMSQLRKDEITNSSSLTVDTLFQLIRGYLSDKENQLDVPKYLHNTPIHIPDQIILPPQVMRLGINIGIIQVLGMDSSLLEYYVDGWLPTVVVERSDIKNLLSPEGVRYHVEFHKDKWIDIFNKSNHDLFKYLDGVGIPILGPFKHIREVARKYRVYMNASELDALAKDVGMKIPQRLSNIERHVYFRDNIREYCSVDPKAAILSAKVNTEYNKYSDYSIFRILGLYFTYDSRQDLLRKIKLLFSSEKRDIVVCVFLSKMTIERYAVSREVVNDSEDTIFWLGNFKIKFHAIVNENAYDMAGKLHHSKWIFPTIDDSLSLTPFLTDIDRLGKDFIDRAYLGREKIVRLKEDNINEIIYDIKYRQHRDKFIRTFGNILTAENRQKIYEIAFYFFETGMYMRKWLGKGTPYPKINGISESNNFTWHKRIKENPYIDTDTINEIDWVVNHSQETKDIEDIHNIFLAHHIKKGLNMIDKLEFENEALSHIFKMRFLPCKNIKYSNSEQNSTILEFLNLVITKRDQFEECTRYASNKVIWNFSFIIMGGLRMKIPNFNLGDVISIS